jgi:hypothetical protein
MDDWFPSPGRYANQGEGSQRPQLADLQTPDHQSIPERISKSAMLLFLKHQHAL